MSRRRSATVTELDHREWIAVIGDTHILYKTRHGAIGKLLEEIDHWIKWARAYDHAALDELNDLRAKIHDCTGDADFHFEIAGLPAHAGLRRP
jgi:hypothetical protein